MVGAAMLLACCLSAQDALLEADADMLARIAWTEDIGAAKAVMWTVINRAARNGTSLLHEATREHQYHGFTYAADPRARKLSALDQWVIRQLVKVARNVLAGKTKDPTAGATHFHRVGTSAPAWAPHPRHWKRFGSHEFYTPKLREYE